MITYRPASHLEVNLSKLSNSSALMTRNKIVQILELSELETYHTIVLNFNGINFLSRTAADEVLKVIAKLKAKNIKVQLTRVSKSAQNAFLMAQKTPMQRTSKNITPIIDNATLKLYDMSKNPKETSEALRKIR